MYVDAKPMSVYASTAGWRMPSPQPSGSLKRPPLLSSTSSSSSLSGMEQAIPSFQSFIRRTPPPDPSKPLPPTPLIPRRASSTSPPRSRTPSSYAPRRSSSVYSRTVSQWFDDDASWRSADLRDDPLPELPPLPLLQPVAYSKSTPQLIERSAAPPPPMLEPRTYSPLIITPSPTASRATTPSRSPAASPGPAPLRKRLEPPAMYPTSPPVHDGAKKKVQTVSLEQANAAVHSPGAVHLLPEELRAQTLAKSKSHEAPMLGKSRSHEPMRVPTLKFFSSQMTTTTAPPQLPNPPTLMDAQGRHRSLQGQWTHGDPSSEYPFPVVHSPALPSPRMLQREREAERARDALETQSRQASKVKAAESLGLGLDDEPRGRTMQRGPRSMDYAHYMPTGRRLSTGTSPDDETHDAQKVALEYHTLLSEQYRQPSSSPVYNSDDSVRAHMKMVPQPLFKNKPAAKLPGAVSGRGSNASESPFHLRTDSVGSKASASTQGSLPLQWSLTPDSVHRRMSTTGSIPISPPTNVSSGSPAPSARSTGRSERIKTSDSRSRSRDERVSMYYPYIGPRKGKKAKERKAAEQNGRPVPPMPLLPADIIAQRLRTPEGSTESSPLRSTASVSLRANTSHRKGSNASSDRPRTPLFQRLAGNAVKYADLITRPSAMSEAHTHSSRPSDPSAASPHSPHLLPSPVKSHPPPVHLGWSDSAKSNFDRSRLSAHSAAPRTPQSTHFTNLPARPLDERRVGGSPVRKGSLFGGLLDGWKERKREEKREELKRIIRVVPQAAPQGLRTRDIVPGMGLVRQASLGVQGQRPGSGAGPGPGGLARRMSAFGWM